MGLEAGHIGNRPFAPCLGIFLALPEGRQNWQRFKLQSSCYVLRTAVVVPDINLQYSNAGPVSRGTSPASTWPVTSQPQTSKDGRCGCSTARLRFVGIPARTVDKAGIPMWAVSRPAGHRPAELWATPTRRQAASNTTVGRPTRPGGHISAQAL